jgi:hypothetical protein
MSLNISLPFDAEAKLRERARAAGKDLSQYVEQLLTNELLAPLLLIEAAEPFASAVDASGVSDEQFVTIVNDARDASRHDRKRKPA